MNRTGQIFSPFVLLLRLSLSCICIVFFYGDKTSIVAHAVSGFYMHGAAVMLGYSELLLPKSIQFFNQARVLFLQLEQILEYCKAIQVFQSLMMFCPPASPSWLMKFFSFFVPHETC
jgi:hypothetical protein